MLCFSYLEFFREKKTTADGCEDICCRPTVLLHNIVQSKI